MDYEFEIYFSEIKLLVGKGEKKRKFIWSLFQELKNSKYGKRVDVHRKITPSRRRGASISWGREHTVYDATYPTRCVPTPPVI